MRQKSLQTRQNVLNKLYNQDIAPEDSEITSFYYHKTLALECLIATFSLCSIVLSLLSYIYRADLADQIVERSYNLLLVFTILGVLGIILKKVSQVKWIKEKKQKNINIKSQIIMSLLEVMLYLPTPMRFTDQTFTITTYSSDSTQMNYNSFISFYLLFNRFIYIIIFLIHSELYYGSRPDRLSRLYTVKFGTFNSVKFLINQKPGSVIKVTFSFNFVILPFAMNLIQGQVNKMLSSFHSCLYFVVVTQATVGYGDITPSTIFGRVVTLLIIMAGVTNTALLLILFMRLMQLRGEQEQSLFLLESLEKKVSLTRARVFRIESQWIYSNIRCPPEEKSSKEEQIKAIRYNNRRNIMLDRAGPINVKRIMLSNFSQIVQSLNVIQEKNNIISKCIDVIKSSDPNQKPQNKNPHPPKQKFNPYDLLNAPKLIKNSSQQMLAKSQRLKENLTLRKNSSKKQNMFVKVQTRTANKKKESFSELINKELLQQPKMMFIRESPPPNYGKDDRNQKIMGFLYDNSDN